MEIHFSKYQGAGNDFIMINNLDGKYNDLSLSQIQQLCNRKFGIGADGLIKINQHQTFDFEVDYYNADGSKSFCGNGGRCAVAFAKEIGLDVKKTKFTGFDGEHDAILKENTVELKMADVSQINSLKEDYELNTGSPHYIHFTNDVATFDIVDFGKSIRYSVPYKTNGINVNAVEVTSINELFVRTYERGVEDETLSCGTGVTACAIAYAKHNHHLGDNTVQIKTLGGELSVRFHYDGEKFTNVWLIGPGTFVYEGTINV